MITWTPPTNNAAQAARDIVSAATWFHSTFSDEVWLWRGQADKAHGLEPGAHTRVLDSNLPHEESTAQRVTIHLLTAAREAGLDRDGSFKLPDLALLAALQHHGAATPLLDVTTDPLIALWMVANASPDDPDGKDNVSGRLFGILRPPKERWIYPLDASPYSSEENLSVAERLEDSYFWYQAPDVTERLRIQRGSFIISGLKSQAERHDTSMNIEIAKEDGENFVKTRLQGRGKRGNISKRRGEVFAINVRGSVKSELRKLLADRSGLTTQVVYPIPWHKPFIEQFSETYHRKRELKLDLTDEVVGTPTPTS